MVGAQVQFIPTSINRRCLRLAPPFCKRFDMQPLSYVQTEATTPNNNFATLLGAVACVLAVVCKRMQQLPTTLGPAVHHGKDTTQKTLEITCNAQAWPQQCWKSCAIGSNIVALATPRRSRSKRNVGSCWLRSLTSLKLCATTPNNTQQHATGCANGCNK